VTGSPEDPFAPGSPRVRDANRLCTELLAESVKPLEASHAFVYAVTDREQLVIVAETAGEWSGGIRAQKEGTRSWRDQRADMAAMEALRSGERIVTCEPRTASDIVAIPCKVDDEVLAVAVVRGVTGGRSASVELDSTTLLALGLAVERYKVQLTLEESLAESDAVKRQLDAYAIDLRSTYLAEQDRSVELASALSELSKTYESTVRGLAIAVEAKDEYTGGHLQRVSRYGMAITAVVAPEHAHDPQFEYGFLLHDVGKLVVPDSILMKEGPLNKREWAMIRGHPEAGRTILDNIPFLAGANEIVHGHHERWDGKGYPRGLSGDEIPLGARIFPLADVFDALTSTRPYREAMPVEEARIEIEMGSGSQFWPDAVDAFMTIASDELEAVRTDEHRESAK
jgi:HD-GYP domain-containing protein (c-di-GMP phosphodiesterase class II)